MNGAPGLLTKDGVGPVVGVAPLDFDGGLLRGVYSIVNPEKLRHLGPVRDLGDLLHSS